MSRLPIYLNRHVGLAMHHLLRSEPPATNAELRAILEKSGEPGAAKAIRNALPITPEQITRVIRAARANVTATRRARNATEGQSVRAACDYKCPEDSIVGIRVSFTVNIPSTGETRQVSTVVNVPASANLLDAVRQAQQAFAAGQRVAGRHGVYSATPVDPASVDMIDSVSLGGFEGAITIY